MGDCGRMSEHNTPDIPFRQLLRTIPADFWRLWFVGLVVFTVRWLETVAVAIVVYQHTGSAFLVAMMTMLRLLPMGLLGAFLGAFAERIERRATLVGIVVLLGMRRPCCRSRLAGPLAVWHLALAELPQRLGWATDNPVRRVMIGEVVGGDRMGTAMSLDVGASNASRMVGPTVGGLLLAGIGIEGVFLLSVRALFHRVAATLLVRIALSCRPRHRRGARPHLRRFRLVACRPAAGRDHAGHGDLQRLRLAVHQHDPGDRPRPVQLGPEGVGILTSLDGIGAFVGAWCWRCG